MGIEFEYLRLASGFFLTTYLPDNWQELTDEQQDQFIMDNEWEHFEGCPPEDVWSHIEAAALNIQDFCKAKENK